MQLHFEAILAELPGAHEHERILVVLCENRRAVSLSVVRADEETSTSGNSGFCTATANCDSKYGQKHAHVEIRNQSWGDGVGWFTQSKISLQPDQLALLSGILGGWASQLNHSRAQVYSQTALNRVAAEASQLRLHHADSA